VVILGVAVAELTYYMAPYGETEKDHPPISASSCQGLGSAAKRGEHCSAAGPKVLGVGSTNKASREAAAKDQRYTGIKKRPIKH
jgi:hypothetical protein